MKPSRLSHWLRVSVMLALCSFTAYACGGARFTAADNSGGANSSGGKSSGGNSSGGSSGSVMGHKLACQGPEDCDDADPCTVDQCGADGICATTAKCGATEKCCDGACGQCCDAADCDDGVKCTDDLCFAGGCSHSPNNANCLPGDYCSATGDCRHKEACDPKNDGKSVGTRFPHGEAVRGYEPAYRGSRIGRSCRQPTGRPSYARHPKCLRARPWAAPDP